MINNLQIKNFKSIKEAKLKLPLIFALVGRNAAGKTNLIQSIGFLKDLILGKDLNTVQAAIALLPTELFNFNQQSTELTFEIGITSNADVEYIFSLTVSLQQAKLSIHSEKLDKIDNGKTENIYIRKDNQLNKQNGEIIPIAVEAGKVAVAIYADPSANELRALAKNIYISDMDLANLRGSFTEPTEQGLADLLFRLVQKNGEEFETFQKIIKKLIPKYSNIINLSATATEKESKEPLHMVLLEEKNVKEKLSMMLVSAGDLRTLFLIGMAIDIPMGSTFIIEEVENGMHPDRVKHLIEHLQVLAVHRNLQLIFTTHSPKVINSLKPSDIIFANKNEENGTVFEIMSEHMDLGKIQNFLESGGELIDYLDSRT